MDQDSLLLTNERVLERIRNPSPPAVDIFEPISIVLCKNLGIKIISSSSKRILDLFLII